MRPQLLLMTLFTAGASAAPLVIGVSIDSMVHPVTVETISHALDEAKQRNASLVLIRINTPGGLIDSTRQITEKIVGSVVPVVTYVTPSGGRAASAGFFLLQAGDVAAMAPGTNTGAASPILLGQQMDQVMRKKVENDTAAALRSVVTRRGRNSELAEKTVLDAKSFTEQEALDNKLIELVAKDETELLARLDGREITRFDGRKQKLALAGAVVEDYRLKLRERIITSIADPNIAFVILILGALGIYAEFSSPGLVVPGVLGSILVLLGLSALSVLPINWLGAALVVLGVAMFVLEAKFVSHGILGAGGAVAMVLGAMLLIDAPPEFRIRPLTAISVTLPFALITVFLMSLVIRARANKVITGDAGMIGAVGVAKTRIAPAGTVFVVGEYWDAVSSAPVEEGSRVRIQAVEGLKLRVEPEASAPKPLE